MQADPISSDNVERVAKTHIALKNKVSEYSISEISNIEEENNHTILCYVADLTPKGFIAISSDNNITPIIAYSFRNNFVKDEENLLYYMLKKDMEFRLESISQFSSEKIQHNNELWEKYISEDISEFNTKDFQQWPEEGSTLTGG